MVKSGDRVGAYEIIAPLGAGGMGILYRARDRRLNREVAIKFLADRHAASDERLKRFDREARAASALNHPHIITVYDIGEHEGRPYIAMELVEGKSLRSLLGDGAPSLRRMLTLAAQIAEGLAAAHERGIVHRDLKPDNVMIAKNGYVKILDFGLAKLEPETSKPEDETAKMELVTSPGLVMGTAAYMSPEQARGLEIDYRSDQFSLGTILYEMLTGKRPFEGATPIDLLASIVYKEPEKLSNLNARVPNAVEWIVERCLRKDPEERYASTSDLARELALARDRLSDATPTPTPPHEELVAAVPSARTVRRVLGVALVAVALVGGGWFALQAVRARVAPLAGPSASRETIYLAVQPFRDASPEPLGSALGHGFAETVSARIGGSQLVRLMGARWGDLSARDGDDPRAICRAAGANRLLRGSLQRSGATLRVTWSLVDDAGVQIAGNAVEGAYDDIFALQDEIALQVMEQFGETTTGARLPRAGSAFAQDRYLEAIGHLGRSDDLESVEAAIAILDGLGDSPMVLAALARAYLAKRTVTDDPEAGMRALDYCRRALETGARSAEIYATYGEVNMLVGKQAEAIEAFRGALALEPEHADALLGLAQALANEGKAAEAEATYRKAIELRPNLWVGHNQLGVFHLMRGSYGEAVKAFKAALAATPDNVRVLNNLGAAYQQMGRHDEALRTYALSLAERPNADAYSNQGTCLFFLGRYDESADAFERATALHPEAWMLWANLGDAYRWSGARAAKASASYRRAIELGEKDLALRPREGYTLAVLAATYAKLGEAPRAAALANLALEAAPEDAFTRYVTGVAFEVSGNRENAVEAIVGALDLGYSVEEVARDPELRALVRDPRVARRLPSQPAVRKNVAPGGGV